MNTISHQYIANWHDSFVNYIENLLGVVAGLMAKPEASEGDKNVLEAIKMILNGRDVKDVERDLAAGVVKKSTLNKIERLNKDLADTCLEHVQMNLSVREFWKQLSHIKIEHDKESEKERLSALQIPVLEE